MSNCIHQCVCQHYSSDDVLECQNKDICKHFRNEFGEVEQADRPTSRAGWKKTKKSVIGIDETLVAYKKAKIYIAQHKDDLSDNQSKAVEETVGKHYSSLTDEQRQQIIDIAEDLKNA